MTSSRAAFLVNATHQVAASIRILGRAHIVRLSLCVRCYVTADEYRQIIGQLLYSKLIIQDGLYLVWNKSLEDELSFSE